MKRKFSVALLVALLVLGQSLAACTIFAVGKEASTDGSTMISHTCDSTSDDLRLYLIPSMEAGVERDIVLSGRAGADYSQFPEVKNYGPSSLVLGSYVPEEATNQYIHGMYSFMNDKGLAMGESTCWYSANGMADVAEQTAKLKAVYSADEGIIDAYMLQDLALENCSSAREAVEFMGAIIEELGWNGTNSCECFNICDGEEAWVVEYYGGKVWVAVRVPDNAVFVCANRARINQFDFNDTENYLCTTGLREWTIEKGLWDGEGDFVPCRIFCPNIGSTYSTRREWMALMLLDPSLNLDPNDIDHDLNWPLFVVPQEKVSVDTIHKLSSNYYQGTEYDLSKQLSAGPFGNPLYPSADRAINCYRCTYIQIANVKSWLPDEAKCLVYFGWGAPDSTYLTPLFASQKSLPAQFSTGVRTEYDENSGWWVSSMVQQVATWNYQSAIQDIYAVREPLMAEQYAVTAAMQDAAAKMIKNGDKEGAIDLLTAYSTNQANMWLNTWKELEEDLITKYMHTNTNMKVSKPTAWWTENVVNKGLK